CRHLRQAIQEQRAALQANPGNPDYRKHLRNHCHTLAEILVDVRQPVEAAAAAKQPLAFADSWKEYHFAAKILTQCLPLIKRSRQWPPAKRKELPQPFAAQSVTHLRKALQKGYPAGIPEITKEFAPLRAHPDFQKLLAELGPKGKSGAK